MHMRSLNLYVNLIEALRLNILPSIIILIITHRYIIKICTLYIDIIMPIFK